MPRSSILVFSLTLLLYANGFGQQAPYGGTPWPIPGKIEAEDYDTGGERTAYHDADRGNNGGQYRSDGVDLEPCGEGGYDVGWTDADEWLEYTVTIAASGPYVIRVRAASAELDGGTFHINFRNTRVTETVAVPHTGGWESYQWIDIRDVNLSAGQMVMRFTVETGVFKINCFEIAQMIDWQYPAASVTSPMEDAEFKAGDTVSIRAEASDADGSVAKVVFFQEGLFIGADFSPPFEASWIPAVPGYYSMYAIATDDKGSSTESDAVQIHVLPVDLPDGPAFSHPHGFYGSPFDLTVSWNSAGASIRYTLDGSDPRTNTAAFESPSPVTIRIDPDGTTGRAATPAVAARAYALRDGRALSDVSAATYIFTDRVKVQTDPGAPWPQSINGRVADYIMDPNVVNDPRYSGQISRALTDIPSVCINTDLKNLFDPITGIYDNPVQRGREWERPASVELFDPKLREEGFQINCGIRIRGGYSRKGDQPKHAFRFFFRKDYGKGRLEYPLFQDEGVSSFDCADLRCAQNYSWSYWGEPQGHAGIYIRDIFSRDCQRDMGQPYTRGRAYHLYLNGMYWGLYQTQERSEASYAESYFGGDPADYDVVKVNIEVNPYEMEATDGDLDAFDALWEACQKGFSANADYFRVQGKNADGSPNLGYPVWVNPENLIDYLLVIYYTGNFDAPVSAFSGNFAPNNYYAIYNQAGRSGFLYFAQDSEHSLMDPTCAENNGMNDYGYDRTGPYFCGYLPSQFNPQWLHQALSENPEYRMLFADRVYKHLTNRGALTLDACLSRFQVRADEIAMAVIAESARWGDTKVYPARTKDDDWMPSVEWVKDSFFPGRGDIVLGQLKDDNLYPSLNPPVFRREAKTILDDALTLSPGATLRLMNNSNSSGEGSIYYTLDGTDPRLIGGTVSASAQDGGDNTQLTISSNTVLKARVKNGSEWSAVHEILLNTGLEPAGLRITEVHYHPLDQDTVGGSEFEFLELKNTGASELRMAGVQFVKGLDYRFPDNAIMAPGGFVVLASNAVMFKSRYGFDPTGEYDGQLDNKGEQIALIGFSGDTLISFRYNDADPWPETADGAGNSLAARSANGLGDPNSADYWRASASLNGSPGSDDPASGIGEEGGRIPDSYTLAQNYPNPFNPSTEIRFTIPRPSFVRLTVYDILGREMARLADGHFQAGSYSLKWNASSCPAGIYVSRLEAGGVRLARKLTLVK